MTELRQYRDRLENELSKLKNSEVPSIKTLDGRVDVIEAQAQNADETINAAQVERDLALEGHVLESTILIEAALERIAQGTYGVCQACGNEIPPTRLDAFPAAARCISCKTKHEAQTA